jgi:hypothetical protein
MYKIKLYTITRFEHNLLNVEYRFIVIDSICTVATYIDRLELAEKKPKRFKISPDRFRPYLKEGNVPRLDCLYTRRK